MSLQIKIDIGELADFGNALQNEASQLNKNLQQAMRATALDVKTTAKKPGYVPYKTGNLRRSITHKIKAGTGSISAIIGSNVDYAAIHEFGGQVGSITIRPKRYVQRAIEDNSNKMQERLSKALRAGIIK